MDKLEIAAWKYKSTSRVKHYFPDQFHSIPVCGIGQSKWSNDPWYADTKKLAELPQCKKCLEVILVRELA